MAAYDQTPRSSLYVGDLHPDVTENDIVTTFARAGPLLSVRLCRDKFSRKSLCYAYVNFWLPCHAYTALECLNHTLLKGKPMRVMWYEKNSVARNYGIGNLFVNNLDLSITSAKLQSLFSTYGTIISCKVVERNGVSRGFGYVQFESEDSAIQALNALHDTVLEGKKLYVDKFRSKIERRGARRSNVTRGLGSKNLTVGRALRRDDFWELNYSSMIVKNLDPSVDDKKLAKLFSGYGNLISAKVVRDCGLNSVFGFVNFLSPDEGKKALNSLNGNEKGTDFKGRTLQMEVGRVYNPYKMFQVMPHYTSVNQQPRYNYPGFGPLICLPPAFNSSNLLQTRNFCGNVSASPMQVAKLNDYGRERYLDTSKITNGNEKEFCNIKPVYMRSSQEIYNINPGYMHQPLIQTLQDQKPSGELQGKLDYGDGKELNDSSDTTETHCTESSPEIDNNLQPGNADISSPTSLGVN